MTEEQSDSNRYPVAVIARLLNLTERRVQQLANEGVVPKPDTRGEYDLIGCVQGYVAYLQERADRAEDTDQKRLTRAKAEREELELAKLKRALVPAEEIAPALEVYVTDSIAALEGLPEKYADTLLTISDADGMHQALSEIVRDIREQLGTYTFAVERIHGADSDENYAPIPASA